MSDSDDHPSVYLFTIDSLRADYFTSEFFERTWNRFDSDFAAFTRGYANGIATPLAFPSILADNLVTGNGVLSPDSTTLAELVPGSSIAIRNNVHIGTERGYDRGFTQFDIELNIPGYVARAIALRSFRKQIGNYIRDAIPFGPDSEVPILYRSAERMVYEIERAIDQTDPDFLWGHFMDPHGPYFPELVFDYNLPYSSSETDFETLNEKWSNNESIDDADLEIMIELYEHKIKYTDRHLANLLDWLEANDLYDDAFIIITADHGQFVGENGKFGHDWDNLPEDELLRVPFVVKFPNQSHTGEEFSHPVQHLDIHRTVADHFDIDMDLHPNSTHLTKQRNRFIISKSNRAIRGIEADGEVLNDAQNGIQISGDPQQRLIDQVQNMKPANVTNDVGQDRMTPEERERINERLAGLGYQ